MPKVRGYTYKLTICRKKDYKIICCVIDQTLQNLQSQTYTEFLNYFPLVKTYFEKSLNDFAM